MNLQIDVKQVCEHTNITSCNLYVNGDCIKIIMQSTDYEYLIKKGFFIRNGKEKDSANVLNTTLTYHIKE